MKLSPVDIANKTFNSKMFGCDNDEVAIFLQKIANQMEELIHERNVLKEQLRQKEFAIADFQNKENNLKSTISTASQMVDKIRSDAEREARLILADAQQKADLITTDARNSIKNLYQDIADLKRTRMQFEANLKALAQAHLSLLEQGEKYVPNIGLSTAIEI